MAVDERSRLSPLVWFVELIDGAEDGVEVDSR